MKCYESYNALKEVEPNLAEELSHEFDFTNDPVEYEFYVYPNRID